MITHSIILLFSTLLIGIVFNFSFLQENELVRYPERNRVSELTP